MLPPSPKKTHVMVLALVMVLTGVIVLARVLVLDRVVVLAQVRPGVRPLEVGPRRDPRLLVDKRSDWLGYLSGSSQSTNIPHVPDFQYKRGGGPSILNTHTGVESF